ncbi:hypothetical protein [Spirosoma oryzicola]|nr:hypothetical protein [Spirosoma oryzicola]
MNGCPLRKGGPAKSPTSFVYGIGYTSAPKPDDILTCEGLILAT